MQSDLVFPLLKVFQSVGIVTVLNKFGQLPAWKFTALAAMLKALLGSTPVNVAFSPEDFAVLSAAAGTAELFPESAAQTVSTAFSSHDQILPVGFSHIKVSSASAQTCKSRRLSLALGDNRILAL